MPIIRTLNPLKDKLARGELAASMTVRPVSSAACRMERAKQVRSLKL